MEAEQLRNELCEALEFAAPMTWETIRLEVQATVVTSMASTSVVNRDGRPGSLVLPDGFMDKLRDYRAACYEPGRGTWYSAVIALRVDGEPDIALHYDEKPEWGVWPHPTSYVRDLELFPRDEEHVPGWLREQIELAGPVPEKTGSHASAEPAAEPAGQQGNLLDQQEMLDRLTRTLLEALPANWQRLLIQYRVVGRHSDAGVGLVKDGDDRIHHWDPPREAWHRFQDLRRVMYVEGQGTWFGVQYKLIRPGRFDVKYNWNKEPGLEDAPAPEEFALEQSRFPRSEEHQPHWYRAGLARASAS
ncbi:hypothetical protein [Kibdelosporangium phytohabitans]|uniref:Uncharacterized protein n=1 Tax=Kibdelosporangium phytohabitans TaxID=860235 RepID=A0A0N7F3V5_9PSEU|nr:hypothetical protein [Kibdelosporangium phytohabitans]ALG09687.1 hypothetical protein AOZ06_24765 [Kibdelosporangium phytohabitans]MBE1468962.1 hypothetical protein [Kibdelosporangium phytohabitans]